MVELTFSNADSSYQRRCKAPSLFFTSNLQTISSLLDICKCFMTFMKGYWNHIRLFNEDSQSERLSIRRGSAVCALVRLISPHKYSDDCLWMSCLTCLFPVYDSCPGRQDGSGWRGRGLIWAVGILWPLQLHLESFHADLEAVHGLDSSLGTTWVIKAHKPWGKGKERERERGGYG